MTLAQLLDRAAQRRPEATAVVDGARRLTYADLAVQAAALGRGLADMGIGRGDRVLIVLKNRLEHVLAYWALQTIGGVAAPVSFRLAGGELRYVLEDSGARVALFEPDDRRDDARGGGRVARAPRLRRRRRARRALPLAELMAAGAAAPARASPSPRATSPSSSTRRARRGGRRACRAPTAITMRARWPMPFSAGTSGASARSASCRSTTRWAFIR